MGLFSGLATAVAKPIAKSIVKKADDVIPRLAVDVVEEAAPVASKKPFSSLMETPRSVESPIVKPRAPVNEELGVEPPLLAEAGKDAFEALGLTAEKKEAWRSVNKKSQRSKLLPEIEDAAQQLSENKITSEQFRQLSKDKQPIVALDKVPEMPTYEDIGGALTDAQVKKGIVGLNMKLPAGERVSSRLDIPAYNDYDTWVVSLHDGSKKSGAAVGYAKTAVLRNVEFVSDPKVALDIARRKPLASGGRMGKATIARIFGDWVPHNPDNAKTFAEKIFNNPEWTQVGMNPYRASYFYDKADGLPVTFAEEVVQIGPLVMAKNVKKTTPDNPMFKINQKDMTSPTFAEGGAVQQTGNFLADGGMMEEGGAVDPVSGNNVPTGSLKEEVRDDINAKLSPGEFVIPADVVRYIGLEKLMKIRDAAKEGLKRMEEVGQMGNAEEAPQADEAFEEDEENDDEFEGSIDEIMSEVDEEEKTTKMAAGGFITGAYKEGMKTNAAVDVRYFKHADGRVIYITYINGKPMTAVPEGFSQTDTPVEQKVGKVAEEKAAAGGSGAVTGAGGGGGDSAQTPTTETPAGGRTGGSLLGYTVDQNDIATANTVGPIAGKAATVAASLAASALFGPFAGLAVSVFGKSALADANAASQLGAADYNMSREKSNFRASEIVAQNTADAAMSGIDPSTGMQTQTGPGQSPYGDVGVFDSAGNLAGSTSNEFGSTNETAAADNSGNTTSPGGAPGVAGSTNETAAADNSGNTSGGGYDSGSYGGYSGSETSSSGESYANYKGGFITKKKPDATKSKKGLASRK